MPANDPWTIKIMKRAKYNYSFKSLTCIALLALIGLTSACQTEKKANKKPNIVYLFTDDLTYRAIHSLGNKQVKTPNIDQLASSGAIFSHAYNMGSWSGAVCTASRSMLISGMSVWRTNEHRKLWHKNDPQARDNTWPKLMEKAGYDTYMTGKWHVDIPADSVFMKTKHIRHGMPADAYDHAKMANLYETEVKTGKKTFNEIMPNGYNRPLSRSDESWSASDSSKGGFWEGGKHWSEVVTDDALGFIDEASKKDKPFFMYLAFNAAHDPRQAPQAYLDMYPVDSIEIPESFQPDYPYHDEIGVGPRLRDEALAPFPRTEFAIKTHLKEYYAIITHLDAQIGLIIDDLKAKGLMQNTYIILTADHGLAVGRHGLLGKQNMYDHSMRPPLMMSGPAVKPGTVIDTDVYYQDLMATALDLAGIEKPSFVAFNSLLPLLDDTQSTSSYDGIYGCYLNLQRMIRKDGYKLIVYPKANKVLLFDLNKDPEEMQNIADKPENAALKARLFNDLLELQKHYDDTLDLSGVKIQS
ncbi:arylsulfatase A-like enzyme [Dyadobacter jejuensis]|uniref:Arylsulfatase A-like enzyme n=2 Tax=Dyadobacter jejuensis TaxID=1082580 RepID=A0A316AK00_9BACT|nr:arylsulfatase A-like enzyme [Dyadobacter jejuensis]